MFDYDPLFGVMDAVMPVFMIAVFGIIVYVIMAGIRQWSGNNRSPVLSVDARVVNMRQDVSHRNHAGSDDMMFHTATSYYATFQVESGDRFELAVSGDEYGLLAQGDTGKLTFQGTRYLEFRRN